MATGWHVVLSRDGTVLGATDGAPESWVGRRLDDRTDVPPDVHLTVVDAIPLRRVATDLRALLKSSLEVMEQQARACDISLNVAVDPNVPAAVMVDAEKLAWAITVLVGNALRYVRRGSQTMPGGSIAVRVTYNSAGPETTIEVQDDGAGIPADKLPLLFKAGLDQPRVAWGLWMIREVVAAHAGHIEVHSDTDPSRRGTTIRLTLPAS